MLKNPFEVFSLQVELCSCLSEMHLWEIWEANCADKILGASASLSVHIGSALLYGGQTAPERLQQLTKTDDHRGFLGTVAAVGASLSSLRHLWDTHDFRQWSHQVYGAHDITVWASNVEVQPAPHLSQPHGILPKREHLVLLETVFWLLQFTPHAHSHSPIPGANQNRTQQNDGTWKCRCCFLQGRTMKWQAGEGLTKNVFSVHTTQPS